MEKTTQTIPFLRLSIALIVGILAGCISQQSYEIGFLLCITFLLIIIIVNRFYRYSFTSYFGIAVHLFLIFFGIFHFNYYNKKPIFYESGKFLATVLEAPQEKPNSYKSLLKLEIFNHRDSITETNEKIIVYFEKDENPERLKVGNKILFSRNPEIIKNNGNPYEFDYQKYLQRKKIYRQVYLPSDNWTITNIKESDSPLILAEKIRNNLLNLFRTQNLSSQEFEILAALTLGYKRGLDPEIKKVFSAAGAMHVLAVSGLHVGIIYGILFFFLGFLRKTKQGRITLVILSVAILWAFAFITGLSPSVMRAATMFSFVSIGNSLKRQSNIYNTLASSAFLLLLINPNNIFEIGFQLSYAAVFGIVFLQPKLYNLLKFKNKIINYFWVLITVSVAAQVSTFPISLTYFHQFPTYFWLSNLFVIPAVFILIPLGILLLIFSGIPFIASFISFSIKYTISTVYFLLQKIEQMPYSVQEFSIQPIELILIISLLFVLFLFIKSKNTFYIRSALLIVVLIGTTSFLYKLKDRSHKQIIVYNSNQLIIHLISGKSNYIISSNKIVKNNYDYNSIKSTCLKLGLDEPIFLTQNDSFKNKQLFLKNRIIYFEGKIILDEISLKTIPNQFSPHIIINSVDTKETYIDKDLEVILVSNRTNFYNEPDNLLTEFNVVYSGAFQKKW